AARIAVGIEVGLIRDVIAFALEEADELDLPPERALRKWAPRALERDAVDAAAVDVVEAVAVPGVVRLPRVHGDLHEDARARACLRLAQDEERRRHAAGGRAGRQ